MLGPRYHIRNATKDDFRFVSANLCESDKIECEALGLVDKSFVYRAMLHAMEARVGCVDGVPITVFGLGAPFVFSHVANPWMLSTEALKKNRLVFLRESRNIVAGWRERYSVLENWVDARNTTSIAWLKWLGFKVLDAEPRGPLAVPFHKFEMRG